MIQDEFTRTEAAKFLGCSEGHLANLASQNPTALPYTKRWGRVFYLYEDLVRYRKANTVHVGRPVQTEEVE